MPSRPLTWRTHDGRVITIREMSDIHLANMITRLEAQALRESYDDPMLSSRPASEIAAQLYAAYPHLVAERARRIEAEQTAARIARGESN